jgi:hypothetical protein
MAREAGSLSGGFGPLASALWRWGRFFPAILFFIRKITSLNISDKRSGISPRIDAGFLAGAL